MASKIENDPEVIETLKDKIVIELANRIEAHYGFRWIKCVDLAMSASWYFKKYTIEELQNLDVDAIVQTVFAEIDSCELN